VSAPASDVLAQDLGPGLDIGRGVRNVQCRLRHGPVRGQQRAGTHGWADSVHPFARTLRGGLRHRRSNDFGVVLNNSDIAVATVQLTSIPGLSRGGATRPQIEGLRVAKAESGQGVGTEFVEWAHNYRRAHGAELAQVTTDEAPERARAFYCQLG